MKKLFAMLLCVVLIILGSCDKQPAPSNGEDPYLPVIKAYRTFSQKFEQLPMGKKRSEFEEDISQGFKMLPKNSFDSLQNWLTYGGRKLYYAFYDIDDKGTKVLLLGGDDCLVDVYTTQNGIAVQQQGVAFWDGYICHLLKTDTILAYQGDDGNGRYNYYCFEQEALKFQTSVVDYGGGEAYRINTVGQVISISEKEYERLKKEYEGDNEWNYAKISWKPLAMYS